jgi:hypothetical protein
MAEYDQVEHIAIRLDAAGQMRWLVRGLHRDLSFARWLETQSSGAPGEKERRADLVAELVSQSGTQQPWACLVEAQGQREADLLLRALEYLARLGRELRHRPHGRDRYPMMAVILNLDDYVETDTLNWTPPVEGGSFGLTWRVWVHNLRVEPAVKVLDEIEAGVIARSVLSWVPLMAGADDPVLIQRWRRLAEQELDRSLRASYGGLALVFAEKAGRDAIWCKELEGFNVQESAILKGWRKEWTDEARKSEREATLRETLRYTTLYTLRARWANLLTPELVALVEAQTDPEVLTRWFELATGAETLDKFLAAITGGNGASS